MTGHNSRCIERIRLCLLSRVLELIPAKLAIPQVTFTDANHWLYLEEPDKFNKLIRDFLVQGLPAVAKYDRL